MNFLINNDTSDSMWFSIAWKFFSASRVIKFNKRTLFCVGITFLILSSLTEVFAQNCPSFQIAEIKNAQETVADGSVIFKINGTRRYQEHNFEVRQKQKDVTGPLDFEISINVVGDELKVSGLKKSVELYLDEYVIFFSDRSCDNGKVVEVGTFKIN